MQAKSTVGRYDSNPNTMENQLRLKQYSYPEVSVYDKKLKGTNTAIHKRQNGNQSTMLNYSNIMMDEVKNPQPIRSQSILSNSKSPAKIAKKKHQFAT
jgi:hypothetical protein